MAERTAAVTPGMCADQGIQAAQFQAPLKELLHLTPSWPPVQSGIFPVLKSS